MSAAVLCIGTELTRGELVNTNASWLAERLTALGVEVAELAVVDDDRVRIAHALRRLGSEHGLLICTGGLGPTTDDLTSECAASVLGVPLERDAASLEAIRTRMARFGRTMAASNENQAHFPRGAEILENRQGTAPGFAVSLGSARAYFLPGVPREMMNMFDELVAPLIARPTATTRQIRLLCFGMPESAVNDALVGLEAEHGVTIGYRAHFPEIEVKVLARDEHADRAYASARAAADAVRARLGDDVVYGEGDERLPAVVGKLLAERGLVVGAAESCTGGLLGKLITDVAGSSAYFAGAVVSYDNSVKRSLLGLDAGLLEEKGAVSEEVARAMAEGVRRVLDVDVALAITGVAGPGGGTPEKPVGLVHIAVADEAGTSHHKLGFPGTRVQIRMLSAYAALALVRRVLLKGHPSGGAT
jgi:nicotinamide-nucleotide amidase